MVDYSVWDHIEVSDDEDDTHPNIDTPSLFRWRHQARLERMQESRQERESLERSLSECSRRVADCERRLDALTTAGDADQRPPGLADQRERLQAELAELRRQRGEWQRKEAELTRKERTQPWNVDTLSTEGFDKSVINPPKKVEESPSGGNSEEEREERQRRFVEQNERLIKHFGMLKRWEDSQRYLSDHPDLVCEETANYLVIWCIDLQVEEKQALMEQVAHQTIVMQFILQLASNLNIDPRGCFRQFFNKVKTSEAHYMEAFTDELEAFKGRVRERARVRLERAAAAYEEEERQRRLGPGGLDPVEVYESLPEILQKCFDSKDIQLLQEAITTLDPAEAKHHMQRCVDSGLWVPNREESPAAAEHDVETPSRGAGSESVKDSSVGGVNQ